MEPTQADADQAKLVEDTVLAVVARLMSGGVSLGVVLAGLGMAIVRLILAAGGKPKDWFADQAQAAEGLEAGERRAN